MRTTINLDDELVGRAAEISGIEERGLLIKEALRALIEREAFRRVRLLAGTQPDLEPIPRRRFPA